jgi:hypothetical protein
MAKLQSALEYITTYGWALLIIVGVASALYYVIIAAPTSTSTCLLEVGFSCVNLVLLQNGTLTATIQQTTQTPVNITAFGCNDNVSSGSLDFMKSPYNPPSNQLLVLIGGNFSFSVPCYREGAVFSAPPGSEYSGYLVINYTNQYTGFPHTIYGKIAVRST